MDKRLIGDIRFLAEYDDKTLNIVALIGPDAIAKHADQLKNKGAWQTIHVKVYGYTGMHSLIILPPGQHLETED
jgi:hypothetical protein